MQRLRLPLEPRVQGLDAAEHFAHVRGLGRIYVAMAEMPFGQRSEVRAQGRAGQGIGIIRQIADHRFTGGRQEAAPGVLEMPERVLIATPGALALGGLPLVIHLLCHRTSLRRTGNRPFWGPLPLTFENARFSSAISSGRVL